MSRRAVIVRQLTRACFYAVLTTIGALIAIRGATGWAEHGFPFPRGHYGASPHDDGSFYLLLLGSGFAMYGSVATSIAILGLRDATHEDETTPNA